MFIYETDFTSSPMQDSRRNIMLYSRLETVRFEYGKYRQKTVQDEFVSVIKPCV